jgi:hypothetical protein
VCAVSSSIGRSAASGTMSSSVRCPGTIPLSPMFPSPVVQNGSVNVTNSQKMCFEYGSKNRIDPNSNPRERGEFLMRPEIADCLLLVRWSRQAVTSLARTRIAILHHQKGAAIILEGAGKCSSTHLHGQCCMRRHLESRASPLVQSRHRRTLCRLG